MAVLAATYFQSSSLMYLAISIPLCLWIAQTHSPAISGLVGSVMAVVAFCVLGIMMPEEIGGHVEQFIVDPFYHNGWRMSPANALQSAAFHIGVPTALCIALSAFWSDPR